MIEFIPSNDDTVSISTTIIVGKLTTCHVFVTDFLSFVELQMLVSTKTFMKE